MGVFNVRKTPQNRENVRMCANDTSLDPRPLPSLHMRRRCSALSLGFNSILYYNGQNTYYVNT